MIVLFPFQLHLIVLWDYFSVETGLFLSKGGLEGGKAGVSRKPEIRVKRGLFA
jgi:hypothetical protein